MQAFGVQLDMEWENKPANFERVRSLLDAQDVPSNSLIVLPEMFATGFSMNLTDIHEPETGQTAAFLREIAQEKNSYCVGGCVGMGNDAKGRNQALCFDPSGAEVARYTKMHPFTFGGETKHYTPGDEINLFKWGEFTVAPFICYDLRFPEIFRHATRMGANVFLVIACWPQAREAHWMLLLRARAIENQAYIIGVNRFGSDPKLQYSGRSQIIDPMGNILTDGKNHETIINAKLDFEQLTQYRNDFPVLQDMRIEYKR